ncbi:minor head protein inhibitor of protease [Cronobacter phage S13]|jgi:hypothetical protein|uniref:Inhibitor of prohead protease n=1 Tax=Cronobacter phage LPCS28 TaxID=2924885 RepID=A0AAE9K841_9CAUD|nr:minor head protein inhibitor of protease [Cronobacter phage S13]YP_010665919.1 minor head protein inhibitor of protease [Cronobacter phage LPCS28]AIA64867.1 putative inhibitor of prohead protease [Cronobacter phage S13]UNY47108.1 hypothetical protein EHEKIMEA_00226 [Cronobacter phage LPCS28]
MKLDYELINSFRQLGLYQSKAAIASYAEENFGLKIQRNLAFDNMVKKLEEFVGADHVVSNVINKTEKVEKFKLDIPVNDEELDAAIEVGVQEIVADTNERIVAELTSPKFIADETIKEMASSVAKSNDRKADLMNLLPPDFKPCFNPMGDIEGFYPLSYWINDWIQETEDWPWKINEYPRVQEHKFLYTLVYYIAIHGKFMIRETRNGQYVTLS